MVKEISHKFDGNLLWKAEKTHRKWGKISREKNIDPHGGESTPTHPLSLLRTSLPLLYFHSAAACSVSLPYTQTSLCVIFFSLSHSFKYVPIIIYRDSFIFLFHSWRDSLYLCIFYLFMRKSRACLFKTPF